MNKRAILPILISLLLLISGTSLAQNLKGFVYDKASGESVMFANIVIKEKNRGTTTDENGFYSFRDLEVGAYTIECSFVGYQTVSKKIDIKKGTNTLNIFLEEDNNVLSQVDVVEKTVDRKTETTVSTIKITPIEIKRMPSIGGQADLAQYLQVLPGVVFTGDQGGQLYIRGGTPVQNLVLLDGMTIYAPFHSIGFTSVFDTEIIKSADVFTAGFGAEYGGRLSSVMDIKTKDGNRKRLAGKLSMNTFGAQLTLQGPLGSTKNGLAGSSFVLSGKKSYIDQTSKNLYKYAVRDGEDNIPFAYTDIYGKLSLVMPSGTKASFYGFNFQDEVNYSTQTNFDWDAFGIGSNLIAVIPSSLVVLQLDVAYSSFDMNEVNRELVNGQYENGPPKTSHIDEFKFNFNVKKNISEEKTLRVGVNVALANTDFFFTRKNLAKFELTDNNTYAGGYLKYKYASGVWVVEPSVRLSYYTELSEALIEPRMALKYNISDAFRLKASGGLYSQNLLAANNGRQVVNLFNGFASSPVDVPKQFLGENVNSNLQKAWHGVVGAEFDLNENLTIDLEGFTKDFYQLVNINFDKIPASVIGQDFQAYQFKDFIYEKGNAIGADLSVKYSKPRYNFGLTYSISKVLFENEEIKYHPHFDRRHNLNLTGSYFVDKEKTFSIDGRFNYGSGFPFAQILGNNPNGINLDPPFTDYVKVNGEKISYYDAPDSGRLPSYLRFDLSATKKFQLTKRQKLEINLTVTNILNRNNIFYYDKVNNRRIDQLPIFPSLGVNWSF
ncbi:MAG: TonB-dependent receptor [Flavobacteriales bacterium]|jgi:hypothetical protein|nr:TonB-dependent receptor [Flavobacteriales bacterium]